MKKIFLVITVLILSLNCFGQNNFKYPIKNKVAKYKTDILHSKGENPIFITDSVKILYKELERLAGENPIYDVTINDELLKSNKNSPIYESELPYPILFVHGLTGDSESWEEMGNFFEAPLGETKTLRFCLNDDGDSSTSNMSNDVEGFDLENLDYSNL
jgi:uncharacterized alpha/beta hydrolase family protein